MLETDYKNLSTYFPFETKRAGQEEVLEVLGKYLDDPKIKYILVEALTGTGKSPIAIAAAQASKSAYVATANKFLQDQYLRDFSEYLVDLKGRGNYRCTQYDVPDKLQHKIGEFYNCGNSPCQQSTESRNECSKNRCCEYHKQLDRASDSCITSFNFASALAFLNYLPKYFPKRNLLICDECHNIPNWITNFISIDFSLQTLKELGLKKHIPDYNTVYEYGEYLFEIQVTVNRFLKEGNTLEANVVTKLETLAKRFALFDKITDDKADMDNFVVEKIYDLENKKTLNSISFKPVVINKVAKDYLFKHADKVLFLSATILDFPTYMDLMGIPREQAAIIKVPSSFPVENRMIYTTFAIGNLNYKNLDANLPKMVETIDYLLKAYPAVKGIIHGVTYKICNYIYDNLQSDRLLFPTNASEQKKTFDKHASTEEPTILLSPSMTEGVDLANDLSRLQIIVKMPYPYLGCPVLKRRIEIYGNYYNMLTALTITQAYGRSVRSAEDFCLTFVLDSCFIDFVRMHRSILQPSFIEAIR